jgi:HK97 family phage portal protein
MGLFTKILRNLSGQISAYDDFWYGPAQTTKAGVKVDEKEALKYLTVLACVTLIAGDIAKLPLNLYKKRKSGGKDLITDHHLYDILHNRPNQDTTSFNFRETLQGHLLLWGNSYAFIDREDIGGKIKNLWQLPDPGQIKIHRNKKNELLYTYKVNGEDKVRTRREVFHIPGFGFNGLVGKSMVGLAREAIGLGLATEDFGSTYFGEGTHPSGIYKIKETLTEENRKQFNAALKEGFSGLGKAHKVMVAEGGGEYQPLTVSMDDAQFLSTRDFQKKEICGMYHVPPHKIALHGANSNRNNLEQENGSYVDSCLMGWIVRWESAISLQLLTEQERRSGLFFEFAVQGLLRGDSQARAEFYNKIFQVGGISPNEIRAKENMNPDPSPEADKKYIMLNMIPLDQADEPFDTDFRTFFKEPETRISESQSIRLRDRIQKQYAPLIYDAARAVVNRETKAIKKEALTPTRDKTSMKVFLNDFYEKFPEYIEQKMGPVLRSYISSIIDATNNELKTEEDLEKDTQEYVDTYTLRHVSSSKGQMLAIVPDGMDAIVQRADEWQDKRPDKIKADEGVRASNFAFQAVVWSAGLSTVWRIRGAETCPYCKSLNGKKVGRGQSFVKSGDKLDPAGADGVMKINGTKSHPGLHQGCDCYLSII